MSKMTLGYWNIRGLAQPIRLLLNYAGVEDFDDVKYEQGDAPGYSAEEWTKKKYTLGLPFPNLPYLIHGDIKITQSNAILRYLGRKYNMLGESDKVYAESEMVLECAMDWRNSLARTLYNKDYDKLIEPYFTSTANTLKNFDTFLEGRTWFAGGKNPTICDFPMYELLAQNELMRPGILNDYKNLKAFVARFEALPKIKAYMQSDRFLSRPCNNKSAGWK